MTNRKAKKKIKWLRTDEIEELLCALEFCAELVEDVEEDATRWKWVIIALHNALQGACVCALRSHDTAGISVLTAKSGRTLWRYLDVDSREGSKVPHPREKLAPMLELFCRVQKSKYLKEDRLVADGEMIRDVKKLNSLRNKLIHFVPGGLSVELSGMPQIVSNCCSAIEHLSLKGAWFTCHLSLAKQRRTRGAIRKLRASMKHWEMSA